MKAYIKCISYYLPEATLTNDALNEMFPEWPVEKISNKTGIRERRIADEKECSSDLAIKSALKLFADHQVQADEIDFVLFCTQSPDYFLPTTACIVQNALGIPTSSGALDYNLGCSGYIYGLGLAKGLIETGQAKNVLLLTAETYSKFIDPRDKSVRTIFGDAGSASVISTSQSDEDQVFATVYGTDGEGAQNLIVKTGGMRFPLAESVVSDYIDEFGNSRSENSLYMNGSEIFLFTLNCVPRLIDAVLKKSGMTMNQIDLFIFHQANKYMLDALKKKIQIPEGKFFIYLENCGNTVSSTIAIALAEAIKSGRAKKGDIILLAGFGVGYSWGGLLIKL